MAGIIILNVALVAFVVIGEVVLMGWGIVKNESMARSLAERRERRRASHAHAHAQAQGQRRQRPEYGSGLTA